MFREKCHEWTILVLQLTNDICPHRRWYLETIYPESQMPLNYHHLGEIRHKTSGRIHTPTFLSRQVWIRTLISGQCLDTMGRKSGGKIGASMCHNLGGNQVFAFTKAHQIMSDDNCLDVADKQGNAHGWELINRDYSFFMKAQLQIKNLKKSRILFFLIF